MESGNFNDAFGSWTKRYLSHTFLFLLTVISLTANDKSKEKPFMIQEQGSFAVGGKVISNPGTFNPYNITLIGVASTNLQILKENLR